MGKKLLCKIVTVIFSLVLTACGHVAQLSATPTGSPTQTQTVAQQPVVADPSVCERALKLANYNLSFAKQQAKRVHAFTDWTQANKALVAATNAYDEKNYDACVQQAQLVNTYIERNQSYIKWRNSLNL